MNEYIIILKNHKVIKLFGYTVEVDQEKECFVFRSDFLAETHKFKDVLLLVDFSRNAIWSTIHLKESLVVYREEK